MTSESALVASFLRALGFLALLPCGYDVMGPLRRVALAVLSGMIILESGVALPVQLSVGAGMGELLIGALLAIPMVCIVGGAAVVGELLDAARGESLGSLYDPSFGHSSSLAVVARNLAWGTLVVSGAFIVSAEILVSSAFVVPLGSASVLAPYGHGILSVGSEVFGQTLRCAAPWIGLCLIIEGAGVLVLRAIPQLSLNNEIFLVKTIGIILLFWLTDRSALEEQFLSLSTLGREFLATLAGGATGVFQSITGVG